MSKRNDRSRFQAWQWWLLPAACSIFALLGVTQDRLEAADWPSYRNGPARLGSTTETLKAPLQASWVYQTPAAPRMSWSSAEGRVIEGLLIGHRVKYDDAIYPVISESRVYFGSSVDHHLHCRDLNTGETLWTFATGGPIRLAPSVIDGRVYFGSDDGHAYCLSADDGQLIWKHRAGPGEEWLLARGDMISRWPVRTGVMVDDGVAFFGAGIFPHEDVYLYAVNAKDGTVLWRQDKLSEQDAGRNDLSPQGYLLANETYLFVPSGRSLPAALDRKTGELIHKRVHPWRTTAGGIVGGYQALLADGQIYASGPHHWLAMEQSTGDAGFGWFEGRELIVQDDAAYSATGQAIARLDRLEYADASRRRQDLEMTIYSTSRKISGADEELQEKYRQEVQDAQRELEKIAGDGVLWKVASEDASALLASGNLLFVGGEGVVKAYSADSGEKVWESQVDGEARALVAASGHLLVSTTTGQVSAFSTADLDLPRPADPSPLVENPFPDDDWSEAYAQAAEEMLNLANARKGFCLIVGNEEGRLAFEIARRSDLQIYAVEPDAEKAQAAREAFTKTGLYGNRIVVHHLDPTEDLPYSNYFANLIVSDTHFRTGKLPANPESLARHLKPLGGTILLGQTDSVPKFDVDLDKATAWLYETELDDQSKVEKINNRWAALKRDALPGAGSWTHQYGSPDNTAVGDDTRIKGGLGVLWYGDPGPGEMVNRHEGAVGPLSINGRLFVQGEYSILAYDAYNGTFLWKHENPEALRTGVFQNHNPANLAITEDRLFHFVKDQCLELDAETGETLRVHRLPAHQDNGQYEWGYLALQEGLLVGAATMRKELEARLRRRGQVVEDNTDAIFAINLETGEHAWTYEGQSISHQTIALGPERVFFIDSSITPEQREKLLREDKSQLEFLTDEERERAEERAKAADIRRAVALDSKTGTEKWSVPVDVTDCSEIGIGGGKLSLMYQDDVLVLGGANANGHYWAQFVAGEFDRRRLVALSASNGYKLWAKDANYKGRPIVIGDQVFAEPWSFDLQSGEQKMRRHPLTQEEVPWSLMRTGHHCGIVTGCDSGMLLFRSGDTAFYDLELDAGTRHFAGHRMGCWINAIPANGLVMIPEASAGCVCLFSIASTIVLEPREARREWAIHSAVGAQTPVRSMALNLGAPGDRKDTEGNLWLSFPRHSAYKETSLDLAIDLKVDFLPEGGYDNVNEASHEIQGTEHPWIYTSWGEGVQKLTLPLLGPEDEPATYRVRLHFAAIDNDANTPTSFDVHIQGELAFKDVVLKTSPATAVVQEIEGVHVKDNLVVELDAKQGTPRLNAIEVNRVENP